MTGYTRILLHALGVTGILLFACGDSPTQSAGDFVVSGTIQNNTATSIPANARLLVAWAGASQSYVFGEGTINRTNGTFQVRFGEPPPPAALNAGELGVGIVIATTNATVSMGDDIGNVPEAELIGAAGRYGVIYVKEQSTQFQSWTVDFPEGYSMGIGVEVPGTFDKFVSTNAGSVILVIDAFANIEFVNWT